MRRIAHPHGPTTRRLASSVPKRPWRTLAVGVSIVGASFGLAACGSSGSGSSSSLAAAGYGGPTPGAFRANIFTPFKSSSGISSTWTTIPGGIVAGMQAQQKARNVQWDVGFELQGSDVQQLANLTYLAKLPTALKQKISAAGIDDVTDYAVPYGRGASIIVCNAKAAKRCPTTPAEFFDTKDFPGSRMFSSFQPQTALAFASEAAGTPRSQIWPMDLSKAEAKLTSIKSSIKTFYSSGDQASQLLRSGEVPIALFWNGNTKTLAAQKSDNMDLRVSWDGAIGFNLFTAVFKGGPNTAAAFKLIEWMNDHPAAQAKEMTAEAGTPALPAALKLMSADIQAWSPGSPGKTGLVQENDAWYLQHRSAVDDFWKSLTSG